MPNNAETLKQFRDSTNNYILKSLPEEVHQLLLPHLEQIELALGAIIHAANEPFKHVYFPDDAMISIVALLEDGESIEVGVVGFEGMLGVDVIMGVESSPHASMAQIAGRGHRIKAEILKQEFERNPELRRLLLRYTRSMLIQISQTAVCNRLHLIEQRLARWLLMCSDRSATPKIHITQEFMAIMLGVTRPSVSVAAVALQSAGFINYSRGNVIITDREGLEEFCCECYRIVKNEFDRLILK